MANPIEQGINAVAVTPDDDNDLTQGAATLFVGVAGDVSVDMAGTGESIVFKNVPAGSFMPIQVDRVNVTGTTATDIVAMHE